MFEDIDNVVREPQFQQHGAARGGKCTGRQHQNLDSTGFEAQNLSKIGSIPIAKSLFSSHKKFAHIQRSIQSIHSAKSVIYGSTFFGARKFYNDEFDFKKEPLHPHDRRKIRFGLKSVVDFIAQLDLQNLRAYLTESEGSGERLAQRSNVSQNS